MDDASTDSGHRCSICARHYKRQEHLRRHYASHSSDRPHRCSVCNSSFKRSDVLNRHLKTCNGFRSGTSTRRRSCDHCVRNKRACNSDLPCSTCLKRNLPCAYSHWQPVADEDAAVLEDMTFNPWSFDFVDDNFFDFSDTRWQDLLAPEFGLDTLEPSEADSQRLQFLDNFTKYTGFIRSFDCLTSAQREQVHTEALLLRDRPSNGQYWTSDPLALKTKEIASLIEEVIVVRPRNSPVTLNWSSSLEESCLSFFASPNLRYFLDLYWAIWHPNFNFVHRPTFNPSTAKGVLVAAMAITGE
jgi:Fungal Zn(2)-Cys(6) binuclear cluster domain/Fungal specific transcription factor domain